MSFKKQYLKSKPICKVTFKLTKEQALDADKAQIVGDFNDWDMSRTPMKKLKNGDFTCSLDLAKDAQYEFRYLLDGVRWENDWKADAYVPSSFAFADNSVVQV